MFDDDKTLGEESEALMAGNHMNGAQVLASAFETFSGHSDSGRQATVQPYMCISSCFATCAGDDMDAECGAAGRHRKPHNAWTSINFVLPAILLASDAVFGMAAGMTVKFFPIFFKVHTLEDLHCSKVDAGMKRCSACASCKAFCTPM